VLGRPWVVLREGERRRWGGDLRRRYLLDGLAAATDAVVVDDWKAGSIRSSLRTLRGRPWHVWRRAAFVATSELMIESQLEAITRYGVPLAVDIHDDPIGQAGALGIELSPEHRDAFRARLRANLDAFPWLTAPSEPFARLAGLPLERLVVAPNGTDTAHVTPVEPPEAAAVAFISGAAPGRGIEALVDSCRIVRRTLPEARLLLLLAGTSDQSQAYLDGLVAALAHEPWIEIGPAPYGELGLALGRATVLCIPTPANAYWDSVPPLKLFDGMASGRPHVTTPRVETARIIRRHDAGLVTEDDSPESIAAALLRLLGDEALARRMGSNARAAAEREFDWAVIGARLADDLLARTRRWHRPTRGSAPAREEAHL
jgi:glycosyltransferase involved in cell wall biosynthesis